MDDSTYRCKDCDKTYKSGQDSRCPHKKGYRPWLSKRGEQEERLERVRHAALELQEALVDLSGGTEQALLAMVLHPDARVGLLRAVCQQDLGWVDIPGDMEPTFLGIKVREELP